jgi:small subunit ribosomal protein S4
MAKILTPSCRNCRREGTKLFLKGEKCEGAKCILVKRNYVPGQHGLNRKRAKMSDYAVQLREKQKVKRLYGVLEKQFRNYFEKADRKEGVTGEVLLQLLETRLDNVVYRLGFAPSRRQARELVNHGHFCVNDKKVNIPSYQLKVGDVISIRKESANTRYFKELLPEVFASVQAAAWLKRDAKKMTGSLAAIPAREELDPEIQEQLIVELYSK